MRTEATTRSKIRSAKNRLAYMARKQGLWENFGQDEVRAMRDHENCNPYGTPEQRNIAAMVDQFDNWCQNFSLTDI